VEVDHDAAMLTLYHHGSSVCAAKVRIVLHEKQLQFDARYIDILAGEQFTPEYMRLNPKAVVPTLVDAGQVLVESTAICEYLDEAYPSPALMPSTPAGRYAVRLWTKAIDEDLHPACAVITFASSHRFTVQRAGPEAVEKFLAATPGMSVTPEWKASSTASRFRRWRRSSSCMRATSTRWRRAWTSINGSPVTPIRWPTSA
jgi:glutathione S-transferase